jgi:hypothetical protein
LPIFSGLCLIPARWYYASLRDLHMLSPDTCEKDNPEDFARDFASSTF